MLKEKGACACQFPVRNVAAGVVSPDVALAIAVEVASTDNRPDGWHISDTGRIGIKDGGAVHFPDGDVAAGVAPRDVTVAVAVEVASIDSERYAADLVANNEPGSSGV